MAVKDFVVATHRPTGESMLVAVDSIEAVVPDHSGAGGCRVYVGGHVYFDCSDTVGELAGKLLDAAD